MAKFELEHNGPNVISESERGGRASSLFWPWCAANVSLLALSYGAFFLGFGISFRQATLAAVIGCIGSFLLVGVSSLAGKRSNAPTMVLSRAAFGVRGSVLPGFLSYLVFVGWETVLVSLATLATGTVFSRIGGVDRNLALGMGFLLSVSLTVIGGVLGFTTLTTLYLTAATYTVDVGAGGAGIASSYSGTPITYAGGGGGAGDQGQGGYGGAIGPNTGSGGLGIYSNPNAQQSGNSGIVIIRYSGSQVGTGGTVTSSGGYTIHTFTNSGTFTS